MKYEMIFSDAGYHSAFMTTFRFDPAVFDGVIRPRLRSNGCRNIAVLADRNMLNASFVDAGPPTYAGTRYHLAKRAMPGAFHSKIVLQLGKDKGRLLVGSANLTGAGLQGNLEIVERIELTQEDGRAAPILAAAFNYFAEHADRRDEAFQQALAQGRHLTAWLRDVEAATRVATETGFVELVTDIEGRTLAERIIDAVGGRTVSRLLCSAPFWDKQLDAVKKLQEALSPATTALVVASEAQDFDAEALEALSGVTLHSAEHLPSIGIRRYHAKVIIVEAEDGDFVLTGSANISDPALFRVRGAGNAEACILRSEAPGAAIARLGFDACLRETMPRTALKARNLYSEPGSDGDKLPPDGGAVFLSGSGLEWHAPKTINLSLCRLHVFDAAGTSRGVGVPEIHGERIWLAGDIDLEQAVFVVASFEGTMSAPMPIVRLASLRYFSRPAARGHGAGVAEDLMNRGMIDARLCYLIRQLLEEVGHAEQEKIPHQKGRDGRSGKKKEDEVDNEEFIDRDAFMELAPEAAAGKASDAAMGSIYDAIALILRRVKPVEPSKPGSKGEGKSSGGGAGDNARLADWRRKQLEEFLVTIQKAYREQGLHPLSITSVTMVRTFIDALRRDGDPLIPVEKGTAQEDERDSSDANERVESEKNKDEKAYWPLEPNGGWVRMLGRCVKAFIDALPDDISEVDLKDEQIACFADVQAAADLVFQAAQREDIPVLIRAMGKVLAELSRRIEPLLSGHRGKKELMHKEVAVSAQRLSPLWKTESVEGKHSSLESAL